MRIDWVAPCRYAENAGDGTMTIVGAGTDTFWLPEDALPTLIVVFLAMRVAGPEDEWQDGTLELAIRLIRPDREEDVVLQAPLQMDDMPPLKQPGYEAGVLLPALMQWEAHDFGLYTFDIYVGTNRQKSVPITLRPSSDLEHNS